MYSSPDITASREIAHAPSLALSLLPFSPLFMEAWSSSQDVIFSYLAFLLLLLTADELLDSRTLCVFIFEFAEPCPAYFTGQAFS